MKKKFPHSVRKYIRKEKARIRRQVLDVKGQKDKIQELYQGLKKHEHKRNLQSINK